MSTRGSKPLATMNTNHTEQLKADAAGGCVRLALRNIGLSKPSDRDRFPKRPPSATKRVYLNRTPLAEPRSTGRGPRHCWIILAHFTLTVFERLMNRLLRVVSPSEHGDGLSLTQFQPGMPIVATLGAGAAERVQDS